MIAYTIDFFKQDFVAFRQKIKEEWACYSRAEKRRALIIICCVALLGIAAFLAVLGSLAYMLFHLIPDDFFPLLQPDLSISLDTPGSLNPAELDFSGLLNFIVKVVLFVIPISLFLSIFRDLTRNL